VAVEYKGNRPGSVGLCVNTNTEMEAAEKAERIAAAEFGGNLSDWFAWKVEPYDGQPHFNGGSG